jgi:hypothetical protein
MTKKGSEGGFFKVENWSRRFFVLLVCFFCRQFPDFYTLTNENKFTFCCTDNPGRTTNCGIITAKRYVTRVCVFSLLYITNILARITSFLKKALKIVQLICVATKSPTTPVLLCSLVYTLWTVTTGDASGSSAVTRRKN